MSREYYLIPLNTTRKTKQKLSQEDRIDERNRKKLTISNREIIEKNTGETPTENRVKKISKYIEPVVREKPRLLNSNNKSKKILTSIIGYADNRIRNGYAGGNNKTKRVKQPKHNNNYTRKNHK